VNEVFWPEFSEQPPKELGVQRRDVRQRMQAGLYLIATTGYSVVQELMAEMAERYGIQPKADSLHRIFRLHLFKAGLIHYRVLPHIIKNGLAVVRLTKLGKAMCSNWGWTVLSSDWEKLIDHHNGNEQLRHTAMVLDFAWQARRRGYKVDVMPIVESNFLIPDVFVERGSTDKAYVEIERGRYKSGKWWNLFLMQGFAAACMTSRASRRTIVQNDIQPLGIGGLATDLQTLKYGAYREEIQQFWLDRW
jgi:hypothetical protein